MRAIVKIYNCISSLSEWQVRIARWLIIIIVIIVTYDVLMRYIFNAPTSWAFALGYMLGASFIAMGFAYLWLHDGNVRIDVISSRFSTKTRIVIDLIFDVCFFFPMIFMITRAFIQNAWFAYSTGEIDQQSFWYPLTWPYKSALAIGFFILSLQGIGTFVRKIMKLVKGGKDPW